jgi:AAA+ superfamily predicted ATPase
LDPALLSRFNISIEFPLPDLSERQAIFGNYAMHLSQAELEILSQKTADLSGRGIKNLCERVERSFASEMIAAGKEEVEVPTLANYLAELE